MNEGSSGSLLLLILPLVLIGFLLWSTRRRHRQAESFNTALQVGDEVVLTSGIYGTIVELDASVARLRLAPELIVTVDRRAVGARAADMRPAEIAPSDTESAVTENPDDPDTSTPDGPDSAQGRP